MGRVAAGTVMRAALALLAGGALACLAACATARSRVPTTGPTDGWIRAEVERRLQEEERLRNPLALRVDVHAGVVTLSGVLGGLDEVRRAIRIAGRVPGVVEVVNHIYVVDIQGADRTSSSLTS